MNISANSFGGFYGNYNLNLSDSLSKRCENPSKKCNNPEKRCDNPEKRCENPSKRCDSPLNTNAIYFTAAFKVLSNAQDRVFVDTVTKELNLCKDAASKLKNTIWNFLRENRLNSLEDIGGEEGFDMQVELYERMMKNLKLSDEQSEFLNSELIDRCDAGAEYVPGGLRDFEDFFRSLISGKPSAKVISAVSDNNFYDYIQKALRQTPDENKAFRKEVEAFLRENNMSSLEELKGLDMVNEQAALVDRVSKKFNLNEDESMAFEWELINRSHCTGGEKYMPESSVYVRDEAPLKEILSKGGYEHTTEDDRPFSAKLFRVMSDEAQERNFGTIFDIFKQGNNLTNSKTYAFLKNAGFSRDELSDLLIDLEKLSKTSEEVFAKLPKMPAQDTFYARIYEDMISEKICEKFNIDSYYKDELKNLITKLHPDHVDGGQNCDVKQVIYEIADKFGLPAGAEKDLEKIISEVKAGGTSKADVYIVNKLLNNE